MNIVKRTFNPLLAKIFRFSQSENALLKYSGNWKPAIGALTISTSAWTVEDGTVTLSSEANSAGITSVHITGSVGESTITNKVTLSDGQIDERIIKLKIIDNDIPSIDDDYGLGRRW
jgi:hypothetical protein